MPSFSYLKEATESTPVKHGRSGSEPFSTNPNTGDAGHKYQQAAADMQYMFVGPVPLAQFLEDFVPSAPGVRPANSIDMAMEGRDYENKFIAAVHASEICPNLVFVNTTSKGDKNYEEVRKPDISAFIRPQPGEPQVTRDSADYRDVELFFEVKPAKGDPFVDPKADLTGDERKECIFEGKSKLAASTRGQMISYALAQNASQFRTCSFSVFLSAGEARLMRWERGGVFVTEIFEWRGNPLFAEFLWRFNHMTATQRGRDPTVTVPTSAEVAAARAVLTASGHFPDGVPKVLHKFLVHDDVQDVDMFFVAPSAVTHSRVLTGRATAGYIAYDVQTSACVYLKDSWRLALEDLEQEGDIYRLLHEKGVPHIAPLVCAGDVLNGDGSPHRTRAHEYRTASWACYTKTLMPHVHYRLVLGIVGTALKRFSCTRDLCTAIRDAAEAHACAYELAEVLHRDISAGNILFYKTADGVIRGILIDWDLCKFIRKREKESRRQDWRTGTWQFMSGLRLASPAKPHTLSDDLESFVHVLTYNLVLYRPMENDGVSEDVRTVFEGYSVRAKDKAIVGGKGKMAFFLDGNLPDKIFREALPDPCANIVRDLRELFSPLYRDEKKVGEEVIAAARKALQSSDALLKIFGEWLAKDEWPTDDGCEPVEIESWQPRTKRTSSYISDASDTPSDTGSHSSKRRRLIQSSHGNSLVHSLHSLPEGHPI
ncbi:hypothetical protein FA95DRAFT_1608825 [Auriscalpium vulgare]|uniref:Uncharacterized protein n=1 Tax=Auriscalpium vulgare TaxID=40419 RepID=A0ACB8RK53_9AGAM|nr:hypothetical protein FA95DRAFT_1608825 [Auriscalpium vulgare]